MQNDTELSLSKQFVTWWQKFATDFDLYSPSNGAKLSIDPSSKWAPYPVRNETLFIEHPSMRLVPGYQQPVCEFWDSIHPVPYTEANLPAARQPGWHLPKL